MFVLVSIEYLIYFKMLTKKYLFGNEKQKRKKNGELIKSQQVALDKFVFKKVVTQENVPNDVPHSGLVRLSQLFLFCFSFLLIIYI